MMTVHPPGLDNGPRRSRFEPDNSTQSAGRCCCTTGMNSHAIRLGLADLLAWIDMRAMRQVYTISRIAICEIVRSVINYTYFTETFKGCCEALDIY